MAPSSTPRSVASSFFFFAFCHVTRDAVKTWICLEARRRGTRRRGVLPRRHASWRRSSRSKNTFKFFRGPKEKFISKKSNCKKLDLRSATTVQTRSKPPSPTHPHPPMPGEGKRWWRCLLPFQFHPSEYLTAIDAAERTNQRLTTSSYHAHCQGNAARRSASDLLIAKICCLILLPFHVQRVYIWWHPSYT